MKTVLELGSKNELSEINKTEENIYNSEYADQQLRDAFGKYEYMAYLAGNFMLPILNNFHFPHAKRFVKTNDTFRQSIIKYWDAIQKNKQYIPSEDVVFHTSEGRVEKKLGDMTSTDFVELMEYRTKSNDRSLNNIDTAKKYMSYQFRQNQVDKNDPRNARAEMLYRAMIQKVMQGYNVEKIYLGKEDTSANATYIFKDPGSDSASMDPSIRRNFLVATSLSNIPL